MGGAVASESRRGSSRKARLVPFVVLCVLGVAGTMYLAWSGSREDRPARLTVDSPYENVRADVKYVGDSACTRCHSEIAASYATQPMGRSLEPIASAPVEAADPGTDRPLFESQGLEYSIETRGGRVIHVESRRDSAGCVVARNQAEVRYVLGSGRQAYSYLVERDGFLTESPITWYARDRKWNLSPSYEVRNQHFNRPIHPDCLFCHSNRVEHVAGPVNRYRPPTFHGYGIGCERCHGPGERHVKGSRIVDGRDVTIVNPANLEPSLRDAVCEQCHLIGRRRVRRAGTKSEDYRPGLPFYRFWSAFVLPESAAENRFAGQVEQMHESRCYVASLRRARLHLVPRSSRDAGARREGGVLPGIVAWPVMPIGGVACRSRRGRSAARRRLRRLSHAALRQLEQHACRDDQSPGAAPGRGRVEEDPRAPAGQPGRGRTDLVNFHRARMNARDRADGRARPGHRALPRGSRWRRRGPAAAPGGAGLAAQRPAGPGRLRRGSWPVGPAPGGTRRLPAGPRPRAGPRDRPRRRGLRRRQGGAAE